jgi:uncharacterized membrane protein YqiK
MVDISATQLWIAAALVALALAAAVLVSVGVWVIAANQSGLVVKRFGPPLPSGRIVALNGEAGYRARLLPPGWHFGYWRWRYRLVKVPVVVVHPGDIAVVVAADGTPIPSERVLAKAVDSSNFQDAEAFLRNGAIKIAIEAYDVECIDTLIGDIAPRADLMKTQTDRKIAEELERTYEVQREAQVKRQALERETAVANLQGEVVRSEQMVRVAQQNALATAEAARGEGQALQLRAEGHAASVRLTGDAEATAIRAVGAAKAEAYRLGIDAVGASGCTAMQIATIVGENKVEGVPDIAVSGDGSSGLLNVMPGRMIASERGKQA